jgi:hypothetical protein
MQYLFTIGETNRMIALRCVEGEDRCTPYKLKCHKDNSIRLNLQSIICECQRRQIFRISFRSLEF